MSIAYFFDMPQVTPDMAAQLSAYINEHTGGARPEGALYHAEGPSETGGWWSFNVWETHEQFTRFYEAFVLPAAEQIGAGTLDYRQLDVAWDTSQLPGASSSET